LNEREVQARREEISCVDRGWWGAAVKMGEEGMAMVGVLPPSCRERSDRGLLYSLNRENTLDFLLGGV